MTILLFIIRFICYLATIAILLRVIVSWYPPKRTSKAVDIIHRLTEPLLAPLRRLIPRLGPLDFSPLVAVILIQLVYSGLQRILISLLP